MIRKALLVAVGGAVVVIGCSGSSSRSPLDDLHARVAAIRAETTKHGADVAGATSVSQVPPMESGYAGWMSGPMSMMSDDMGAMAGCHDAMGGMMDESDMLDAMSSMASECAGHWSAMSSTTSMGAMQSEEMRHQSAMGTLLDDMDGWMQGAGGMMGSMRCGS